LTLIPPPGMEGSEVEGVFVVPRGSKITIKKAYLSNRLIDNPITFEVSVHGAELPYDVPIRIDLFSGNENAAGDGLNPHIYKLVAFPASK
jgi:hypothetical protein